MKKWILGLLGLCVCVVLIGYGGAKKHYKIGADHYQAKDYPQAFKFFTKACDGGFIEACNDLGQLYEEGKGVKQNGAKALKLYAKACESGIGSGCANVGKMYDLGLVGVVKDYTKARSYYAKACELNHSGACSNLGVLHNLGKGGKQDSTKALYLYKKACDLDFGLGCQMQDFGMLIDSSMTKQESLMKRAAS